MVEEEFNRYAAINVVSLAELYGGKICAALDRQHPRDLFDVRLLFDDVGFDEDIKYGFIVALISHKRPLNEVIKPTFLDQKAAYAKQFAGMSRIEFSYEDFERTRIELVDKLFKILSDDDKNFLISFKKGQPDWELLPFKDVARLPAVQWKLLNIRTLSKDNPKKYAKQLRLLEEKLYGQGHN